MRKIVLAAVLFLNSLLIAAAQEQMVEELNQLPIGVTDLSTLAEQADAAPEVFSKNNGEIEFSDIVSQVQQGGQIYTAGNSAIIVREGTEPVLLLEQQDGSVQAMFICRILPICNESPE